MKLGVLKFTSRGYVDRLSALPVTVLIWPPISSRIHIILKIGIVNILEPFEKYFVRRSLVCKKRGEHGFRQDPPRHCVVQSGAGYCVDGLVNSGMLLIPSFLDVPENKVRADVIYLLTQS